MTESDERRARLPRGMLPVAVGVLMLVALVFGVGVVIAAGVADAVLDEGAVPATSRLPDVPADAQVLSQEKMCGSGGCWWELRLRPAEGQSPSELATAMGVDEDLQFSGTLLDPRAVFLSSEVREDELRIILGYEPLFP